MQAMQLTLSSRLILIMIWIVCHAWDGASMTTWCENMVLNWFSILKSYHNEKKWNFLRYTESYSIDGTLIEKPFKIFLTARFEPNESKPFNPNTDRQNRKRPKIIILYTKWNWSRKKNSNAFNFCNQPLRNIDQLGHWRNLRSKNGLSSGTMMN